MSKQGKNLETEETIRNKTKKHKLKSLFETSNGRIKTGEEQK